MFGFRPKFQKIVVSNSNNFDTEYYGLLLGKEELQGGSTDQFISLYITDDLKFFVSIHTPSWRNTKHKTYSTIEEMIKGDACESYAIKQILKKCGICVSRRKENNV